MRKTGSRVHGFTGSQVHQSGEHGFSLIESLFAITILSFGLLAVAGAFAQGLGHLKGANLDMIAREKAAEAVESVFTARDTRTIQWARVRNVQGASGSDGGVFRDGALPLTRPGADGLLNTDDDGNAIESLVLPGPDQQLGTGDDVVQILTNFTREIEIRDLSTTLRQLRVIIRYSVGSEQRNYTIVTYISSWS